MNRQQLVVEPPDLTAAGLPEYANVSNVSFTPFDFRITFSLLETPLDARDADPLHPTEPPRAVVEVVMPPAAIEALMELLRVQLQVFSNRFGAPAPALAHAGH